MNFKWHLYLNYAHYSPGFQNSHQMALKSIQQKAGKKTKGTFLETFFPYVLLYMSTNRRNLGSVQIFDLEKMQPVHYLPD